MARGFFPSLRASAETDKGRHRSRRPSEPDHTEFFGSQVGGQAVINYSYTDLPWKLLAYDIQYFFIFIWALPWILWPMRPCDGGDFDELAFNRKNVFCIFMHAILIVLQLTFLVSIPFLILFPVWMVLIGLAVFFAINRALCRTLNGRTLTYVSDPKYASRQEEHAHEKWVFLNGVAVGETWMMANLNRLALTFKREITGIHNQTSGIIFDVVECLIQRSFGYATTDVRIAYRTVKEHLYDQRYSKVVFILHSQGGIEGGLVLDWLLQELPQDLLAKLEVYTFGCAANHFNNPHRHELSQKAEQKHLSIATTTTTTVTKEPMTDSPVDLRSAAPSRTATDPAEPSASGGERPPTPSSIGDTDGRQTSYSTADRAIGHIEHYAHTTDFVALWGVLHFVTNARASPEMPRFIGRVFARTSSRGGHQFCQHYLDGMFPLARDGDGAFTGCADRNDFMDSIVAEGREGADRSDVRENFETSWELIQLAGRQGSRVKTEVAVHGSFHEGKLDRDGDGKIRVKDLSRLWLYRNGASPPGVPSGLTPDADGVVRAGTWA